MKRNPNFTKEILSTPNPNDTLGLYYIKGFVDFDGNFGYKIWKKSICNNKLKYIFDAVYIY